MVNVQEDLQDKLKIKVINTPMNMQGELVLDFKNCQSLTITLYPKFNTIDSKDYIKAQWDITSVDWDIETVNGVYKVNNIQVVWSQQPAIVWVNATGTDSDWTARSKINEIILLLRTHGLILT